MTAPPGGYPDPRGGGRSAYWDGSRWVLERGDAQRQVDVAPPERQQPTEAESDESARDRKWARAKERACASDRQYRCAHFDVLKQVLEDVTDSTGDPIDQLTGELTEVTSLLFGMTFIASSLVEKVAELSGEARRRDSIEQGTKCHLLWGPIPFAGSDIELTQRNLHRAGRGMGCDRDRDCTSDRSPDAIARQQSCGPHRHSTACQG